LAHVDDDTADEVGGLQQQRHPGLAEEQGAKAEPTRQLETLDADRDDDNPAIDRRAMDRARDAVVRAHTLNQDGGRDLLPEI